ncbi:MULTISPECIES: universal stress protein [unclassified Pseudoalteromonas]|uniref:universal stress protein n=1 Tax=unclassified Pseudoalteromonas TaxID=194690 RepID=UPI0025B57ADA|nr:MULTISPECIES: universal stress protein [unclassified Pseudoalteromonas]MDN3380749.1 universal stress protein [Pseudoalteromonas sp. APC 3893]MDN3389135.1 universal stress protein [Pseudoalteromonas sp. APC 4017]
MKRFSNVLYVMNEPMDKPSPSLLRAISLAKNSQADLTLLLVIPSLSLSSALNKIGIESPEIETLTLTKANENLRSLIASLDNDVNIKAEVKVGKRYLESIRAVLSNSFDILLKEVDKLSWFDRLITSDDMHLLRNCPCPVWLMKKDEKLNYKQILAAVNFDSIDESNCNLELNNTILELACAISLAEFSTTHVVNVYDAPNAGFISLWVEDPDKVEKKLYEFEHRHSQHKMEQLLEKLKHTLGQKSYNFLSLRAHIIKGTAEEELPKAAQAVDADLVVMGTISRTGVAGLVIGNTAETILNQLDSSILAVKPKGFISPISL